MARAKKKPVVVEVELEPSARDYVMARLLAARKEAQAAIEAIDDAVTNFVEPEEDDDLAERTELVDAAIEHAGALSRALESAQEILPQVDPEECEPWDEDADADDDDDDDDGDEPRIPTARVVKQ